MWRRESHVETNSRCRNWNDAFCLLVSWQSNQEVEEEIAMGRRRLAQRQGAPKKELKATKTDVISGMLFSGIVQGFSTPPLLLLIMLMTNNRKIMGNRVNTFWLNVLGWLTTAAIFVATVGLVVTWFI